MNGGQRVQMTKGNVRNLNCVRNLCLNSQGRKCVKLSCGFKNQQGSSLNEWKSAEKKGERKHRNERLWKEKSKYSGKELAKKGMQRIITQSILNGLATG